MASAMSDNGQSGTHSCTSSLHTNSGLASTREAQINFNDDSASVGGGGSQSLQNAEPSDEHKHGVEGSDVVIDRMSESVSIQEESPNSLAEIVTGVEQSGAVSLTRPTQPKLPTDVEKELHDVTEQFKAQSMKRMNEMVCSEPGLNPLISVAEAPTSGEKSVQIFMTIFTLALHTMTRQVNIMKQWYRSVTVDDHQLGLLDNIKTELNDAKTELRKVREEKADLMQQLSDVEEKQRGISDLDPTSPASSLAQNTQGYVRVEHVEKPLNTEDGDVKLRVEEVNQRESELERKISKLKSTQKQLVEANTEWEKHCREITEQNDKQFKAQSDELKETQRRCREQRDKLKEYETQIALLQSQLAEVTESGRVKWTQRIDDLNREFEDKINNMSEDLARKEAAYQSLRERLHGNENPVLLQRVATNTQSPVNKHDLEKRVLELELQVVELRTEQRGQPQQPQTPPLNLNIENKHRHLELSPRRNSEPRRNLSPPRRNSEPRGAKDNRLDRPSECRSEGRTSPDHRNAHIKQYKTQIGVLQAQITAFKEDFDIEKADRERAQAQKLEIQQQFQRVSTDNLDMKRLIDQKEREFAAVKHQNDFVRQQYTQKCRELETERARVKEMEAKIARLQSQVRLYHEQRENVPHQYTYTQTTSPHDVYITRPPATVSGDLRWRCQQCTYDNIQQRITCEMCGQQAPHVQPVGNIVPDTPRLLARNVEQADGNRRMGLRNNPNTRMSYYTRDIEEDTQFLSDMN